MRKQTAGKTFFTAKMGALEAHAHVHEKNEISLVFNQSPRHKDGRYNTTSWHLTTADIRELRGVLGKALEVARDLAQPEPAGGNPEDRIT